MNILHDTLPDLPTLRERMIWARNRTGLKQEEVADRAGCSRDVITKIEIGRTKMPRNIADIARVVDVPPAWLQFGAAAIDRLSDDVISLALRINDLNDNQKKVVEALIDTINKLDN